MSARLRLAYCGRVLERIRLKVWSGQALEEAELEVLRRAALEEGGPRLRTAVAQALINRQELPQAVGLLEALRRDFPTDAQVHLALGRALMSLERWDQAEHPLRRALELQPGDSDATRALAALALRNAEWRRARALVEQLLAVDPADAQGRLLLAELDARQPPEARGELTLPEFARALSDRLRLQSTPHLVQKDQLLLRLGRGGVARLDLSALHQEAREAGPGAPGTVAAVARELAVHCLALPPGAQALTSRVLPVVRDSAFLERGLGGARREGPAGLWLFYAVEDPEVVLYVPEAVLPPLGLTLEALDEAAWRNLAARPAAPRALEVEEGALRLATTPTGLWALAHGDGHDAARLLTPSHQAALAAAAGPGPWRVYLGLRELVLACAEDDAASVAKLEALDAAREGIRGTWRLAGGRLTPVG